MGFLGFTGLHGFVTAIVLLAISFFVLCVLQKVQSQGVKVFGYVIAVFLWICAALVFGKGICKMQKCGYYKSMRHQMMKEKLGGLHMDKQIDKE